jgi:hypothetical protein
MHKQQLEVNIDHDQCHNPAKSKLNQTTTWKKIVSLYYFMYYKCKINLLYIYSTVSYGEMHRMHIVCIRCKTPMN